MLTPRDENYLKQKQEEKRSKRGRPLHTRIYTCEPTVKRGYITSMFTTIEEYRGYGGDSVAEDALEIKC